MKDKKTGSEKDRNRDTEMDKETETEALRDGQRAMAAAEGDIVGQTGSLVALWTCWSAARGAWPPLPFSFVPLFCFLLVLSLVLFCHLLYLFCLLPVFPSFISCTSYLPCFLPSFSYPISFFPFSLPPPIPSIFPFPIPLSSYLWKDVS